MNEQKIYQFIEDQINRAELRAEAYIYNQDGRKLPNRNAFVKLRKYISDFLEGSGKVRWVTVPGLRGTGKTTMLYQLYQEINLPLDRKLFISVDQVTQILNTDLHTALEAYEEVLAASFESLDKPVVLFLDEIQYDSNWAATLKTLYDRTKNVFIFATGSSALALNTDSDTARRTVFEKLLPLSFTEYIKITQHKYEVKGLGKKLRDAIFSSDNAHETYQALNAVEADIKKYWREIEHLESKKYLRYGTLPFTAVLNDEALAYDQLQKMLDRIISVDIPQISNFSSDTISQIPQILYRLADTDQLSLSSVARDMDISRPKLSDVLQTLERTETVQRILPYGSHSSQARKPSKYLFVAPAFRSMYFNLIGSTKKPQLVQGKLLEDLVGLYLMRLLPGSIGSSVTYDNAKGGADFVLQVGDKTLVVEVSGGDKGSKQVKRTMDKVNANLGLVIANTKLQYEPDKEIVKIPLRFFVLM